MYPNMLIFILCLRIHNIARMRQPLPISDEFTVWLDPLLFLPDSGWGQRQSANISFCQK